MDQITSSPAAQHIPLRDESTPTVINSLHWDSRPPAAAPPLNAGVSQHDETLLVAALEEIERNRLAIETLLDEGLLSHCLADQ